MGVLTLTQEDIKTSTWEQFTTFSFQLALLLLVSIILPFLTSAIMIGRKRPSVILSAHQAKEIRDTKRQNKFELVILRIIIVLLFPLVPAMIILSSENSNEKRKSLKGKINKELLEEWEILTNHLNETRLALLTYKRNELSMELIIQQSITLTMVLLSQTSFPTNASLQSIFFQGSNSSSTSNFLFDIFGVEDIIKDFEIEHNTTVWFLVFSVLWSFKTCVLTSMKIKAKTKNFLPFFPKIVLAFRYFFIFGIRIIAIVSYFSPFLGLSGLINHYQSETISFDIETWTKFNNVSDGMYHYWNPFKEEFQSIHTSKVFRSDYSIYFGRFPKPPPTTNYTLITLGNAYIIFLSMFSIYAILVTVLKYHLSSDFKSASISEKVQHVIEALNNPEAFTDWDSNLDLDVNNHLRIWSKVLIEMKVMCLMQVVTNLIMIVPFWITGTYSYEIPIINGYYINPM